jgi:transposase
MLQLTPQMRILVAIQPVDFRKGIDGLAALCRNQLAEDPMSGTLFLFRNRPATALRVLAYDGQGFWLYSKRLSKGQFSWWPTNVDTVSQIDCRALQTALWNGNPINASFSEDWRKIDM